MDLRKFTERTGKTFTSIAKELDVSPSLVSQWNQGKSVIGYDFICKLFDIGMTFEEMFGIERWETIKKEIEEESPKKVNLSKEECVNIVKTAFRELSL